MDYSDKHRKINVTTDNVKIQATLPLFGEGPAERRKRLQNLISSLYDDEIAKVLRKNEEDDERVEDTKEGVA
ncbi:unnamed protein product [Rotaria magnacalcarata]|uniref:Pre-mRNA processing factor 4 (PRP4)-like domain-containing protein n=1 Tax=Rotaria magnacalcarata TaxID=392030 RepID=A0A816ZZW1_9BILA|nr:unnamed protein product [Rotaria magnacalcarata]CAF4082687.1 unnamed protein product [Rotaria magnacalcarata]